jgi:Rieske 2Fe-2S family protein
MATTTQRTPAEEYTGPPKEWFFGDDWLERDIEAVFRPRWLVAGHVDEIDANGKHGFITFSLGRSEVFIRRDEDRTVRAFYNVCPHRGARLCEGTSGSAPTKRIVCPYHQWTYSASDGHLISAREMHPGFDQSSHGLKEAHAEVWMGLIFICFAEQRPAPLSEHFADASVGGFDLERTKLGAKAAHTIDANWKVVVDNNQECYHCAVSHPELCELMDWRFMGDDGFDVDEFCAERAAGQEVFTFPIPAPTLNVGGKTVCEVPMPRFDGTGVATDSPQILWEPGVVLIMASDSAWIFVPRPLGPEKTELRQYWLVSADAEEGRDYQVDELKEFWNRTMQQDRRLCESVQRGMGDPAYVPGPLNRIHQSNNAGFFRWYEAQIEKYYPDFSPRP